MERLIDQLDELGPSNCFLCDEPFPFRLPVSTEFVTIVPGDGTFPPEFFHGGGDNTLSEDATVRITAFVRCMLDEVDHAERAYLGEERGLLTRWKRRILRALVLNGWEPTYNGNELLRSMLRPTNSRGPFVATASGDDSATYAGLELTLETQWDWDLGTT